MVNLLSPAASATELRKNDSILREMNIPEEIIDTIPLEDANDLVTAYLSDPNSVSVSTSTLEVNVLEEISQFVRSTESELLSMGYSEAQIERATEIINTYNNTSDDALLNSGLSPAEVSYLRAALDPDSEILPQGDISPSKLTLTQTITNYCTSSQTNYFIGVSFNWVSPYIWDVFYDKVVIAWGGDLAQEQVSQGINYYDTNALVTQFTDFKGVGNATYSEKNINHMGVYEFPQGYYVISGDQPGIAKSGYIRYELYQNGFQNRNTKVLAYYAHQISSFTGQIQFTGTSLLPSITIGTGYDKAYTEDPIKY